MNHLSLIDIILSTTQFRPSAARQMSRIDLSFHVDYLYPRQLELLRSILGNITHAL